MLHTIFSRVKFLREKIPFQAKRLIAIYTVRIFNTDALGHANYLNTFHLFAWLELLNTLKQYGISSSEVALHQDGVCLSKKLQQTINSNSEGDDLINFFHMLTLNKRHFRLFFEKTKYIKEAYLNEEIQVEVDLVDFDQEAGQMFLKKKLERKSDQKIISIGYYALQKYIGHSKASLSDHEVAQLKKTVFSAAEEQKNPIFNPAISMLKNQTAIGQEIFLNDMENIVQKNHTDNEIIEFHKLFEIIHSYCHEKGILGNAGFNLNCKSNSCYG